MAKIDQLLSDLEAVGEVDTVGVFTLDRHKAREKMRMFRLADPHRYVLLLVQMATFKGATRIQFDIDADDVRMTFDGPPFTKEDLDELYTSMFADRRNLALRARHELALAINAAMALNPRFIRLRSSDGERGVRAEMVPGKDDDFEELESGAGKAGSFIHVKDRFRPGLLLEFVRDLQGEIAEEKVLRQHCQWSHIPVWLDGKRISHGPHLHENTWIRLPVQTDVIRGEVGFDGEGAPARLRILNAGVSLTVQELVGWPRGFVALIDGTALRKDVSQTDVVHDEAYEAALQVLEGALDHALLWLCRGLWGQVDPEVYRGPLLPAADREPLHAATDRGPAWRGPPVALPWLFPTLRSHLGRLGPLGEQKAPIEAPVASGLCQLPLWPTLGRAHLSTQVLHDERDKIEFVSRHDDPLLPPDFADAIVVREPAARSALRKLFGERTQDRTSALETAIAREYKRREFLARRRIPKLSGTAAYVVFSQIEAEGMRGEVAVRTGGAGKSVVELVKDGCLLQEFEADIGIPGFVAVIEADFDPSADFSRVCRDLTLGTALSAIVDALHAGMRPFIERCAGKPLAPEQYRILVPYLHTVAQGGLMMPLLRAAGYHQRHAKRQLGRIGRGEEPSLSAEDLIGPMTRLRVFETADGSWVDLTTIIEEIGDGPLRVVSSTRAQLEEPPHLIVKVRKLALETLEHVLGKKRLSKYGDVYARLVRNEQWDRRPAGKVELRIPVEVGPLSFERRAVRGLVGVSTHVGGDKEFVHQAMVRVFVRQRELMVKQIHVPVPGVVVAVDFDRLTLGSKLNRVGDVDSSRRIEEAVHDAITSMLVAIVEERRGAPDTVTGVERSILLGGLKLLFPHPELTRRYAQERRKGDKADVHASMRRYYGLLDEKQRLDHEEVVNWAFAQQRGSKPSGKPARKSQARLVANRSALLEVVEGLEPLPVFETVGGGSASLGDVLELVAARLPVYAVEPADAPSSGGGPPRTTILVLGSKERPMVDRILGGNGLRSGKRVLADWLKRRAFEQKPALDEISLGASALVRVDVEHKDVRGEVGIPIEPPQGVDASRVQVCRHKRVVCDESPRLPFPVVAVLDGDFGERSGFDSLVSAERARVGEVCRRASERLGQQLARAFAQSKGPKRQLVGAWIRRVIRAHAVGKGRGLQVAQGDEPLHSLVGVPVFPLLGGESASLSDLDRSRPSGSSVWATGTSTTRPDPEVPVVLAQLPGVYETIKAAFGPPEDYDAELARRDSVARRKALAPPLPTAPDNALASVRLERRGINGALWIDPSDPDHGFVGAGADGKVVDWIRVSEVMLVSGAVEGSGLRVTDDWATVEPRERQRDYMRDMAAKLYTELAREYEQHLATQPNADGGIARAEDIRSVLQALAIRMTRARRERGKWKDSRVVRLYRELIDLPLFRLATGRLISAKVAQREMPAELAHLGLWEDDDIIDGRVPVTGETYPTPEYVQRLVEELRPEPAPAPEPEAEPAAAPEPEPPKAPPDPRTVLLEAVREELRMVRGKNEALLSEAMLDVICLKEVSADWLCTEQRGAIVLSLAHPVTRRALSQPDPLLVSMLASSAFTAINRWLEDVTDRDEEIFHRLHAQHVASAVRVRG